MCVQGSIVMGTGIYFYVCTGVYCHGYSDLFLCVYRGLLSDYNHLKIVTFKNNCFYYNRCSVEP